MPRRKAGKENTRRLQANKGSYLVSIPISLIRDLRWQDGQQVVVRKYGKNKLIISDWPVKKKKKK
jgi:antitoxin component of MazEF toxin-antitoxin module